MRWLWILVALAVAGCGAHEAPVLSPAQQWSPPATTVVPAPVFRAPVVDRASPDLVARAVLETWFGWNTNTDESAADAPVRAAGLLTSELARAVSGTRPVSPGARWIEYARLHVTVTVQVEASAELVPPETSTEAYRVFEVTQSMRDPQGVLVDTRAVTVGVVLAASGVVWSVSKVDERSAG